MANIKPYEEITVLETFDGVQLRTKADLDTMQNILNDQKFVKLNGELVNTSSIKRAKRTKVGELESFILKQDPEMQEKLRIKKARLKKEMNKTMDLQYAKNFVNPK